MSSRRSSRCCACWSSTTTWMRPKRSQCCSATSSCDVEVAFDGEAALAAAEHVEPHVGILDLGLPRIDGFELARRIRRLPWAKRTLLIALSGWGQEEDRIRSREAGFDLHLVKPVDSQALLKILDTVRTAAAVRIAECRRGLRRGYRLLADTVAKWSEDRAPRLAAALAYYAAFSFAPILLIAIGLAGVVFGEDQAREQILRQASSILGTQGAASLESLMGARGSAASSGALSAAIGFFTLLARCGGCAGATQGCAECGVAGDAAERPRGFNGRGAISLMSRSWSPRA